MEQRSDNGTRLGRSRRSALLWIAVALAAVAVLVAWAAQRSDDETASHTEPAVVEPIEGTSLMRVRLTARAAERIDLQTTPVRDVPGADGAQQTVVPYSALLYDTEGKTWVYTRSQPLAFVRAPVVVERITGPRVILSKGPPSGTAVVSVGAALLYGTELGVDH